MVELVQPYYCSIHNPLRARSSAYETRVHFHKYDPNDSHNPKVVNDLNNDIVIHIAKGL